MSDWYVWGAIAGIVLATILTRSSLLVVGLHARLPPAIEAALRYAPACALTSVIVPDLLYQGGELQLAFDNYRLLAGVAGIAIFAAFRNTMGTIVGGMIAFWLLALS